METNNNTITEGAKQNFSKYDVSGTDPNRYASVSNAEEADTYLHKNKKSIIPGLRVNMSKTERILMVAAGSYLLYNALKNHKSKTKKTLEGLTAGTMLFRGISGYCPAYDLIDKTGMLKGNSVGITTSYTINKPVEEVYKAWRQLSNLPQFMKHLSSVEVIDEQTSKWKARIPGGIGTLSWKAEILSDKPNELLTWQSLPGSTVHNAGKVAFISNGATTDIEVSIAYHAPLGKAGEAVAKLFTSKFEDMLEKDIKGFKEYIENGTLEVSAS
ncbi:SRPBCC family protein [Flavobacterium sp. NRK1]|uniref:SRPBCC family protein n=1 Tax=Flavobacterium sp. NRK1 TaxID=2954929 RepID=UPI0020930EF1|nr:SRPBCC family protein [Flavobacterium sp. NRK1]MCO6148446.1 DUF2892 domain-containing protein [Flavobacterium sp. NRK1]